MESMSQKHSKTIMEASNLISDHATMAGQSDALALLKSLLESHSEAMNLGGRSNKLRKGVRLAAEFREKSWIPGPTELAGGNYSKTIEQAANEAVKILWHNSQTDYAMPIFLLLYNSWNDALDWAHQGTTPSSPQFQISGPARHPRDSDSPAKLSVLHPWVEELSLMQQAVLMTAIRGPDGIRKDHPVKVLLRYFRRCVLVRAFEKDICFDPHATGGGSFTGPLLEGNINDYIEIYLRHVDELPHHFQLHLMHAAEIVGYRCPNPGAKTFWNSFYHSIVHDAHLQPESKAAMMKRLGDSEVDWRAAEEVTAK